MQTPMLVSALALVAPASGGWLGASLSLVVVVGWTLLTHLTAGLLTELLAQASMRVRVVVEVLAVAVSIK